MLNKQDRVCVLFKGPYRNSIRVRLKAMICFVFSVCPKGDTLTETSGVITSPYFPKFYPNNQHCLWQITAPQGNHVKLEFEERFNIQQCNATCPCDYIQIRNGFSDDTSENERICSLLGSKTFYSIHSNLTVLFVSDNSKPRLYDGFNATYTHLNYTPPSK